MTIKLCLFFIAMDLLTLMAYPVVFLHGKLRWFSIRKETQQTISNGIQKTQMNHAMRMTWKELKNDTEGKNQKTTQRTTHVRTTDETDRPQEWQRISFAKCVSHTPKNCRGINE